MKRRILFVLLAMFCLTLLVGCSCEHVWTEADCRNPKTCSECQETEGAPLGHDWSAATCEAAKTCTRCAVTEGEPLGHTPGEWTEVTYTVAAAVYAEQNCTVCGAVIASETRALDTLVQDGLFLFTPDEFMDRLTQIADQHSCALTYEFIRTSAGLQVFAYSGNQQLIIQFFRNNATTLAADETGTAAVWCVSLTSVGSGNADLRQYFFMACDPTLDKDAAFAADISLSTAFLNAASAGETFGYLQQNGLLYETLFIPEGAMGQDFAMDMVQIYASDFR